MSRISFKTLNKENIDELMNLQDEVFSVLDNTNLFRKNEKDMFLNCLDGKGNFAIGAYDLDTGELIGAGIAVDATGTPENLNTHLAKYKDGKINGKTINMKNTMVSPRYRGLGLQRNLLNILHYCIIHEGYEYAIATVHPDNRWSVNNLKTEGYIFDHEEEKYGGLKRAVYIKNLMEDKG